MEVILLKDTDFGDKGATVKVADGFARNYLFPGKLAVEKTASNARHVATIEQQRAKKLAREKAEVEALLKKITDSKVITLKVKGREDGALFGAVTHAQIADLIREHIGIEIDRRRVMLRTIKEAGAYDVPLKLTFGLTAIAKIKVDVELDKNEEKKAAKRKPRKKEEILSEIEATEAEVKAKEAETAPVVEAKAETKVKAKKAKAE